MRFIALSTLTLYLSTCLCSCHSQKQVQLDSKEEVQLTNTSASFSSDSSFLNMVSSWSCDFDSLELAFIPRDTAKAASLVRVKTRRLSVRNRQSVKSEKRSDTSVADSVVAHRTTAARNREEKTSSNVYKPPNTTAIIIIALALCVFVLFVRLRKK